MKLTDIILEVDFDKYRDQQNNLAKEIDNKFGGDPYVTMGEYAGGRTEDDPLNGKGYGSVKFRTRDEFEDSKWNQILDFIKSKGLDIQQESNFYESEPGEREHYPKVDFHFNIKESQ
jgi:hypothetical protein|tara:strand:+ start:101 stop:451 length:351 start_codon:yes stop_codon:yes gene_type:complete